MTSGEQLMVVDGQQQQIVIDQGISYQSQQLQPQQIQVQHPSIYVYIIVSITK